jgi:hypothetical protein
MIVKCSDYLPAVTGEYETNLGMAKFYRRAYASRLDSRYNVIPSDLVTWYKKIIICDIITYNKIQPQWWKENEEPLIKE